MFCLERGQKRLSFQGQEEQYLSVIPEESVFTLDDDLGSAAGSYS